MNDDRLESIVVKDAYTSNARATVGEGVLLKNKHYTATDRTFIPLIDAIIDGLTGGSSEKGGCPGHGCAPVDSDYYNNRDRCKDDCDGDYPSANYWGAKRD